MDETSLCSESLLSKAELAKYTNLSWANSSRARSRESKELAKTSLPLSCRQGCALSVLSGKINLCYLSWACRRNLGNLWLIKFVPIRANSCPFVVNFSSCFLCFFAAKNPLCNLRNPRLKFHNAVLSLCFIIPYMPQNTPKSPQKPKLNNFWILRCNLALYSLIFTQKRPPTLHNPKSL